jgi:hypothetical protein
LVLEYGQCGVEIANLILIVPCKRLEQTASTSRWMHLETSQSTSSWAVKERWHCKLTSFSVEQSHAGKVVDRHWYEKNKHIFSASRWEVIS